MRTKRILSIALTLVMLLGMLPGMSLTASAADSTTEITPSNTSGTMTITLTIAAAQAEELLTTITATGKEQASYSTDGVATVSFSYTAGGSSAYLANWGWWGYGWTATVAPANGYTITKCVFYDDANRTATDSEAPFVVETTEEDKTPQVNGTPILAYTSKGIKKIEVYGYATPMATHSVTITAGDHMTKTADSGETSQTDLSGAMTDVVYTADNGYYYPTDYSVAEVSGIKVTRDSYTQITVSGTPTADAAIALTAPTAKTTPDAPTTAAAENCTTADNNDGKLTGVTTAMEYKTSDAADWTAGTGSDITGLVPGTYYVRVKATDTTNASANQELTVKGFISYTVTFKVVNGSWNDETTTDKTVTLTGYEGDTLKLAAADIPAVGTKPNDTYKAGSWDTTPSADTEITGATTYTYTYAQKDTISQTVTFKVVNGSWNDETTTDKTVTLTGYEGDTLKLAATDIPAVGSKPNDTYKAGSWDTTPSTETEITAATTYTYTYAQKDSISQTVTFKVVNGSWNDETTADKIVTLTGYEGDTLKLAVTDIPAVGSKPNDTYKAGSWDTTPSADTEITADTTYTYTYAQKDSISQTVTFKVVNGSWNDETTTDKTVTLTGYEDDTLKLTAAQIPSVGSKPSDTYKAGNWDVKPSTETAITEATTYTYTYAQKDSISRTVTFKVVNGSWNDETTTDKTVTLTGYEGDTLKLTAAQIPAVGSKPNDTYKAGSWDVTPSADTEITAATTYTYTYAQKDTISQTVTFKVVNGSWNDETTTDKTVTLTGYEGDTLKLAAADIPAVGTKPNDTYKAGSWDVTPSADTEITGATTYTYTYAQKDSISQTVTFKVVNGSWNDETTADKTVTLTGYEGDTLKLAVTDIPAVGTKPNDTYKAGSWDTTPSTETEITAATTYTYTYAQKDSISQTVTFKVVNGSWNDETTTDKTVTLTGYEGDTLKLAAADIPAVGTKPNDTYKAGSWDTTPSADTEITGATTYTYTYAQKDSISQTVTFKVVNGSWNDETTTDKTVTLTGYEGDTLKLTAAQIPAVGSKPSDTYKAGNWDVTPSTETAITEATTYTYTYAQKDSISQTVTFKVVNGSWNDETTTDKTVTLTGYEGDTLKLAAADIPAVGTKPNDTYKAGSWDVTPSADTEITGATTYTYTYAQKDSISQTVTFKVVNGSWNDETTTDKTVTLTGYEGDTLKLTADQIPTVGTKPNDTYKAGSWDTTPSTETAITEATTYTYTYAAKEASVVTKAPKAKTLTYNGQAQELINAGSASSGTMQYALGSDATTAPTSGYSTSIPSKTNAGTYYVWYKVVGDETHKDSVPKCVVATIKEAPNTPTPTEKPKPTTTPTPAAEKAPNYKIQLDGKLKATWSGSKIRVSWGKVTDADEYTVKAAYCGTKKYTTFKTGKTSLTIKKLNGKKLNLKKEVKLYVVANAKGKKLAKSIVLHVVGPKNKKYTNAKNIKLSTKKITVKAGNKTAVKAKLVLAKKGKKALPSYHAAKFRYASSDKEIATVDKKGRIKGVKAGKCDIYVYALNGFPQKVSVTVQ